MPTLFSRDADCQKREATIAGMGVGGYLDSNTAARTLLDERPKKKKKINVCLSGYLVLSSEAEVKKQKPRYNRTVFGPTFWFGLKGRN